MKDFVAIINAEAREQGMTHGLEAVLNMCNSSMTEYTQIMQFLCAKIDSLHGFRPKLFWAELHAAKQILGKLGMDFSGINIQIIRKKNAYCDKNLRTIYLPEKQNKISIKSLAHEYGHLMDNNLDFLCSEKNALKCEFEAITHLTDRQNAIKTMIFRVAPMVKNMQIKQQIICENSTKKISDNELSCLSKDLHELPFIYGIYFLLI